MAPKPPNVRDAPAEPWRRSGMGWCRGGPRWPPSPPMFATPRRSRGAALEWVGVVGARDGRLFRCGPRDGRLFRWGPRDGRLFRWGPRDGPQTPQMFATPRRSRGAALGW